jgi:hypothetical protein
LDRARRYDALTDARLDHLTDDVRRLEARRERAHAKLRERLDALPTRKALSKLRRLTVDGVKSKGGIGVREAAGLLLRRSSEKLRAHDAVTTFKRRELRQLEQDAGRLLYTLELFADVLTNAGDRLRSQLVEAQVHLAALRDAEAAFDRHPSMARRGRRDSLRAGIASRVSFLTGSTLREEVEAAIGSQ